MPPAALMDPAGSRRLPLNTERQVQDAIADLFTDAGVAFERECRLGEAGIVDFRVEDTAIEIKIAAAGAPSIASAPATATTPTSPR